MDSSDRTWEATQDGWRSAKDAPEDPDWMYEIRVPSPGSGMGLALLPQFRRMPPETIERIRLERQKRLDAGNAAWATMSPFSDRTRCVKCGNDRAKAMYRSAEELHFGGHDVIARMCERCDFVWYERPIDAEAEAR